MLSHVPGEKSALTPAAFLVRGLAAGLIAGLLAFVVAFAFGEPYVDDAIALEEAAAAQATADGHGAEDHGHTHSHGTEAGAEAEADDEVVAISRADQRSWGLLTGTLAVGIALGGLTALAAAAAVGRLGGLSARACTALAALIGFVAVSLVPFTKYPATPPAVGSGETIGDRTASYFGLVLLSVVAAVAAVVVARRLSARIDGWSAAMLATGGYVVVVTGAGLLLPAVNEVGDFPADTLWYFRRSAIITLAALWAGIGVVLTLLVGRLHDRATAEASRRALAASL